MAILVTLITQSCTIKVVWDGSKVDTSVKFVLGATISPILDLQMLEVIGRHDSGCTHGFAERSVAESIQTFGMDLIERNREKMIGPHTLLDIHTYLNIAGYIPDEQEFVPDASNLSDSGLSVTRAPLFANAVRMLRLLAHTLAWFVSAGFLPDSSGYSSEAVVDSLRPLLDRSEQFIASTWLGKGLVVTFDSLLCPIGSLPSTTAHLNEDNIAATNTMGSMGLRPDPRASSPGYHRQEEISVAVDLQAKHDLALAALRSQHDEAVDSLSVARAEIVALKQEIHDLRSRLAAMIPRARVVPTATMASPPPESPTFYPPLPPLLPPVLCSKTFERSNLSEVVEYQVCTAPDSVLTAVDVLSRYTYVLLDCEGESIGREGGKLSYLSLGTPFLTNTADIMAQHIYLIDVLAMHTFPDSRPRDAIAALLASPGITKIVWDGRNDEIELLSAFGEGMANSRVLDLQVAEVLGRKRVLGDGEPERRARLFRRAGPPRSLKKKEKKELLVGLHVVLGLDAAVKAYLPSAVVRKDPRVKKLFAAGDGARVLERPAPPFLLDYAASDIRMLAHILRRFHEKRIVPAPGRDLDGVLAASARRVSRNGVVGRGGESVGVGWLLLLDALIRPLAECTLKVESSRMKTTPLRLAGRLVNTGHN
ncbi:hypothetical protein K488DRAFT_86385 [Vararia minispora EC-137]|uniref:Uncharacterized protein n=1 Tax=Vararia minispora EC-137 TaxID=1314806 RepID=A0ACB8QJQ2_9AGAM|nr:hypothetical protein K488DRAFT_86385 [Vararia minispora EC-137]